MKSVVAIFSRFKRQLSKVLTLFFFLFCRVSRLVSVGQDARLDSASDVEFPLARQVEEDSVQHVGGAGVHGQNLDKH